MTTEYTEEQLQDTNVAKGFKAFTFISDLMKRYVFDLRVNRGGRIFTDSTNDTKLRRKFIKGSPDQNEIFEVYKTQDGSNVPKAVVEISDTAFTPAMLLAAVASKLANDADTTTNRTAIMFIQAAAALLQEGKKEDIALANVVNKEHTEISNEFYQNIQDVHVRAYATTMIADIAQYTIGDNDNIKGLVDTLQYLNKVTDEVHGEGARKEATDSTNLMFAAVSNLAFSGVFTDVQVMADEIKNNIGEAAMVELSGVEQQ